MENTLSITENYLKKNEAYVSNQGKGSLPLVPSKHLAVVACMDARLDVFSILGLREGEAHIIRNAGGVVTDDAMRSLIISQRLLGTTEIVLMHHTDCGMLTFTEDGFRKKLTDETGVEPSFSFHPFTDTVQDVRDGMERVTRDPFLLHRNVRGFVFDVATGHLAEVDAVAVA